MEYETLNDGVSNPQQISGSSVIHLLLPNKSRESQPPSVKVGDKVNTGQRIPAFEGAEACVVSTVTGTVSAVEPFIGSFGNSYDKISIDVNPNTELDPQINELKGDPTLSSIKNVLSSVPGNLPIDVLTSSENTINNLVINCSDTDLKVVTNQNTVKTRIEDIKEGLKILKKVFNITNIILAVPESLKNDVGSIGVDVKPISSEYPSALPKMIMKNAFGRVVPAGKTCEEEGSCFVSAEATASIGIAFKKSELPVNKTITLIDKDGNTKIVSALIGTPVIDVLTDCNINLKEKDRIIIGGPMTGMAVYSTDYPVLPDTDAIIVQDQADIPEISDYPCINCGECVRICPANVPVNLLVRFLEAGEYEDAQVMYDLDSCIECGLCSYVCVSKMPVFQYITLAKYELAQIKTSEANND